MLLTLLLFIMLTLLLGPRSLLLKTILIWLIPRCRQLFPHTLYGPTKYEHFMPEPSTSGSKQAMAAFKGRDWTRDKGGDLLMAQRPPTPNSRARSPIAGGLMIESSEPAWPRTTPAIRQPNLEVPASKRLI
ncbi:hypothetical protein B0H66DRAFT_534249 [Apodospora peruviana]|uniref:Uncharacterized protein n=1 Tax=Apodospora peruviana TaxID=516989 RepID=A0AAE0I067_9PEZI|nr:hypothetical protein B0H66DRAFT_534249 [Apodospora peruviana]